MMLLELSSYLLHGDVLLASLGRDVLHGPFLAMDNETYLMEW